MLLKKKNIRSKFVRNYLFEHSDYQLYDSDYNLVATFNSIDELSEFINKPRYRIYNILRHSHRIIYNGKVHYISTYFDRDNFY